MVSFEAHPVARRRGNALQHAIFEAVFDQLNEVGYGKLTMDRVATAAQTGKAVLYRRWEDKEALVLDALKSTLPSATEVPPGETLRADLLALLGCMRAAFDSTRGTAFHVIAAEAGGDCRSLVNERVIEPTRQAILLALTRAAERGEVAAEAVNPTVAGVGPAMIVQHSITDGTPMSDEYLSSIVDDIVLPLVSR